MEAKNYGIVTELWLKSRCILLRKLFLTMIEPQYKVLMHFKHKNLKSFIFLFYSQNKCFNSYGGGFWGC